MFVIRLDAYDRNSNFNGAQELEPEYNMSLPDSKIYKDLHADMTVPRISMDCVGVHLHIRTIRLLIELVSTCTMMVLLTMYDLPKLIFIFL